MRDSLFNAPDQAISHLVVAAADNVDIEQPADCIPCAAPVCPAVAGMKVLAAVCALRAIHLAKGPPQDVTVREPLELLYWFSARPNVHCVREQLHNLVVLQLLDRFMRPIVVEERHVRVDPGNVFPVGGQARYGEIYQPLLVPKLVRGAQLKMLRVAGFRHLERAIAER